MHLIFGVSWFIIWPSNFSTKLLDVIFVYRVVWSVLPYDLHNYPISIIQYSCDFVSGPVSYRVLFYLFSSETELEGWSSHSRFLYMYMLGFFFSNFFYHFSGTNQWFCDFLTVIIVIISLLMGRGDIVRNIWLSFPFPTLPFNLPYTDVILTLKPPGIPVLLRPSPFPNNRGLGSSKLYPLIIFGLWLIPIKQGGVWWGAPAQVAGRRRRRSIHFRPAPTRQIVAFVGALNHYSSIVTYLNGNLRQWIPIWFGEEEACEKSVTIWNLDVSRWLIGTYSGDDDVNASKPSGSYNGLSLVGRQMARYRISVYITTTCHASQHYLYGHNYMLPPQRPVSVGSSVYKWYLSRQLTCWSLRCSWRIACQRCSNYIFILDLTHGFNGLGKDNCMARRKHLSLGICCVLYSCYIRGLAVITYPHLHSVVYLQLKLGNGWVTKFYVINKCNCSSMI